MELLMELFPFPLPSLNFIKDKESRQETALSSAEPGCCEWEKFAGKVALFHTTQTIGCHHSNSSCHWFGTTKAFRFEFHMFTSSLFVTTSRFPATWGFSHIKPLRCNSHWRYMTNCFPNVLPRRVFRFVTGQINSLSFARLRQCTTSRWPRLTAYRGPQVFVFLIVHSFDRDGCLSKAWKTNDDKSYPKHWMSWTYSFDFLLRSFILWLQTTFYLLV